MNLSRFIRLIAIVITIIILCSQIYAAGDSLGPPFPDNLIIANPDPELSDEIKYFSGIWEGTWINYRFPVFRRDAKMGVQILGTEIKVTYAWGAAKGSRGSADKGSWQVVGKIENGGLEFSDPSGSPSWRFIPWERGSLRGFSSFVDTRDIIMRKVK